MKKITLKNFLIPDKESIFTKSKMYRVYLGNSCMYYFTAEFKVKQFLQETNAMLNDTLHIVNELYSLTFKEFREVWLYTDHKTKKNISNMFQTIDITFSRTFIKSQEINIFVFRNIFLIIQELIDINTIIKDFYMQNNDTIRMSKINFIQEQLQYIVLKLENWNSKNATEIERL